MGFVVDVVGSAAGVEEGLGVEEEEEDEEGDADEEDEEDGGGVQAIGRRMVRRRRRVRWEGSASGKVGAKERASMAKSGSRTAGLPNGG